MVAAYKNLSVIEGGRGMSEDKSEYSTNQAAEQEQPFSKIPNWFFDELYPQVKSHYAKDILIVIARKTFGWVDKNGSRKTEDRISYSQFEELTGLNRRNVARGLKDATEFITIRKEGQYCYYSIKPVTQGNQLPPITSYTGEPVPVTQGNQLPPKPVTQGNTQKKVFKENIKKRGGEETNNSPANAVAEMPPLILLKKIQEPKPIDPELNHPAVKAYRDTVRKTPGQPARAFIIQHVTDLERWQNILNEWVLNGWNVLNVSGMVNRYTKTEHAARAAPPPAPANKYDKLESLEAVRKRQKEALANLPDEVRSW
jgi:hypothetical protein